LLLLFIAQGNKKGGATVRTQMASGPEPTTSNCPAISNRR
jgi:hypothetical protein